MVFLIIAMPWAIFYIFVNYMANRPDEVNREKKRQLDKINAIQNNYNLTAGEKQIQISQIKTKAEEDKKSGDVIIRVAWIIVIATILTFIVKCCGSSGSDSSKSSSYKHSYSTTSSKHSGSSSGSSSSSHSSSSSGSSSSSHNSSSSHSSSSSGSNSSNSTYHITTYSYDDEVDNYDSAEDYADDWADDFDSWDDAYDYYNDNN